MVLYLNKLWKNYCLKSFTDIIGSKILFKTCVKVLIDIWIIKYENCRFNETKPVKY